MMSDEEKIDPGHRKVVAVLRIVGPLFLAMGGLCMLVAFIELVGVMNDMHSGPPCLFWLFFIGMPLLFIGFVMTLAGFAGKIARFQAAQYAPVAKDTLNYMAEGTQDAVKTVARAVGEGVGAGISAASPDASESAKTICRCPKCGFAETTDAKFCSGCGTSIKNAAKT